MDNISFLIGSGFSIPASIPTTGEINNRLKSINESEICIHTSQDAWFLKPGEVDPNAAHMNVEKRKFVQAFIEFYNSTILDETDDFHYEDFFDYYISFLNGAEIPTNLSEFLDEFKNSNHLSNSHQDLLFNFNLTFNQLIESLLHKKFERASLGRPYHPNYKAFLNLLDALSDNTIVHLHSLNHDLYMEYLSQSQTLSSKFDDGFQEIGSPFYGRLYHDYEKYMVRLPIFINKYINQFRLYKLHGSIDHYWFNGDNSSELIKLKYGIGKIEIFKEIEKNGILKYLNYPVYFHPDFLSGTTSKIERYDKGDYYPLMFNYFTKNFKKSDYLIIIGYGFGDSKINEIIEENFNLDDKKKIFIIDIKKPHIKWFESSLVYYIDGGVVDMDISKILSHII